MKKLAELFQQRLGMSEELSTKAAALAFDFTCVNLKHYY